MTNKQVATDVIYNGLFYTVTAPDGETWSFDSDDLDEKYAISALYCWSRWLDYIKSQNG